MSDTAGGSGCYSQAGTSSNGSIGGGLRYNTRTVRAGYFCDSVMGSSVSSDYKATSAYK